jgi:hypothetical protein
VRVGTKADRSAAMKWHAAAVAAGGDPVFRRELARRQAARP